MRCFAGRFLLIGHTWLAVIRKKHQTDLLCQKFTVNWGSESRKNRVAMPKVTFNCNILTVPSIRWDQRLLWACCVSREKKWKMSDERTLLHRIPHLHRFEFQNPISSSWDIGGLGRWQNGVIYLLSDFWKRSPFLVRVFSRLQYRHSQKHFAQQPVADHCDEANSYMPPVA